jgi:hypothetical protein
MVISETTTTTAIVPKIIGIQQIPHTHNHMACVHCLKGTAIDIDHRQYWSVVLHIINIGTITLYLECKHVLLQKCQSQ